MPPAPTNNNNPKAAEDRRITRMHQMEMMEAAARGTTPSMQLDTSHVGASSPAGLRSRVTSSTSMEARRFLADEEEEYGGAANIQIGPAGTRGTSTGATNLFNQRELYGVDQSVNLMDPATETYTPVASTKRASFVDIFLGGAGTTTGTGSAKGRGSVHTTWQESVGGRFCILLFFVGFGVFLAVSVSFLVQDPDNGDGSGNGGFVKTGNRYEDIKGFLLLNSATHVEYLTNQEEGAYHALRWLTETDAAKLEADDSEILARFALASFYYSTHMHAADDHSSGRVKSIDSGWRKDENWMSSKSVCQWYGVDCETVGGNRNKDVVHFNLTSNKVTGTIPEELKSLSNMVVLDLSSNQLEGSIPGPLCRMFQITYFLMQDNKLTGTIPNQIGMMEGASEIYLTKNKLTGTIPTSISKLSNLRALFLDQNILEGSIPDLTGLASLNHLNLHDNKLTADIPFSVSKLHNLHDLRLSNNKLTGKVISEIANNKKLRLLYLGNNLLTGTIPDMFDEMRTLTDLELHSNRFTGLLPKTFGSLTELRRLTIDSNRFSGTLPKDWSAMTDLEVLVSHHNEIVGSIPPEFGQMTSLTHIILNHNFLQYKVPTQLARLTKLRDLFLEKNAFTGAVPTELAKLTTLEKLRVMSNKRLTGTMPSEICALKDNYKLQELEADCATLKCECCTTCH